MANEFEPVKTPEHQSSTQNPKDQRIRQGISRLLRDSYYPALGILTGFVVGGGAAIYAQQKNYDDLFGKPSHQKLRLDEIDQGQPQLVDERDLQYQIIRYQSQTNSLNLAFYELAKREALQKSIPEFRQVALEHLIEGAIIVNEANNQKIVKIVKSDEEVAKIAIGEVEYNLNNLFEFHQAFALIDNKLKIAGIQWDLKQNHNHTQKESEQLKEALLEYSLNESALLWLKNQKLAIGFIQNSTLLVDTDDLATLARLLMFCKENDFGIPHILFAGTNQYGGQYFSKGPSISRDTAVDYTLSGDIDSLIHEIGHHISFINKEHSLEKFTMLMDEIEKKHLPKVKDRNNLWFFAEPRVEQYAYLFAYYFESGELMQKEISDLQNSDPAAAEIVATQFAFFKDLFKGKTYARNGLTNQDLTPKVEKPQKYEVGQSVRISDLNKEHPGIILRNELAGPIEKNMPAVFNRDRVKLLSGPFVTLESRWDESQGKNVNSEVAWWYVSIEFQTLDSYSQVGHLGYQKTEGFIRQEYLGNVVDVK